MGKGTVTLSTTYNGNPISVEVPRITEVKISRELDGGDPTPIINGDPVSVPTSDKGYEIEISSIYADSIDQYIKLAQVLKALEENKGTLSVFEEIKTKEGTFPDEQNCHGVLISSNEYTLNAEDLSASELTFTAEKAEHKVNGIVI